MIHVIEKSTGLKKKFSDTSWQALGQKRRDDFEIAAPEPPAEITEAVEKNKAKKPEPPADKKRGDKVKTKAGGSEPPAEIEKKDDTNQQENRD